MFKKIYLKPLGWLEKFLQTDIRYLVSGSTWVFIGKIAGTLVTFILSIAYARYLLKGVYGDYRYIFSIIGMVSILTLPGVGSAIVKSVASGFPGTFRKGVRLIFLSSLGMTVILLALSIYFNQVGNKAVSNGLLAAAILVPFMEGLGGWRAYLDGKKAFRKKTKINIKIHFAYSVLMISAVFFIYKLSLDPHLALPILISVYLLVRAVPNIFILRRISKEVPKETPPEPGAIRYGIHLSLSNIPGTIATHIDNLLLYNFLGPVSVAIYSFSIVFPEQLKGFLSSFASVGFPKLAEKNKDEAVRDLAKKTLPKKIFKATLISAGLAITYILLAPYFYELLFPRYIESLRFSQIFALSLITFPFAFFGDALIAEGNIKKIYLYRFGIPIFQILALVILVPMFGIWGAVIGRLSGRLVQHLTLFILFKM